MDTRADSRTHVIPWPLWGSGMCLGPLMAFATWEMTYAGTLTGIRHTMLPKLGSVDQLLRINHEVSQ